MQISSRFMKKRWIYLGLAVLIGLGLTGCEELPTDGSRLPRYSYDESHGYGGWDDWDGWDAGNGWDSGDDDWDDYWDDWDEWDDWDDDYYNEGGIGDVMENAFFNFRVDGAFLASSYGDYEPEDGYELVDVTVWIENTFRDAIPMYNMDFMLHWGEDSDYTYGLSALADNHSEIMPDAFYLERGEDATYHLIYEVPKDAEDYFLLYWEEYDDGYVGGVYSVSFNPESRQL